MVSFSGPTFRAKRSPNFENLRRALLRQGPAGPVPFIELFADPAVMEEVLGEKFPVELPQFTGGGDQYGGPIDPLTGIQVLDLILRFCYETGYDYVFTSPMLVFPRSNYAMAEDPSGRKNWSGGKRFWQDEETGPIQSWADFESFPWPKADHIGYGGMEYLNAVVPEGMRIIVDMPGIFENTTWLMGFASYSYALYDQPDLVQAITERVAELVIASVQTAVTYDNVGAIFFTDDLGYSNGTLVSPATLRKHFFPYYRRLVNAAHAADRLILLHSCGNLEKVMDDIIEIGFDAKHSFEDKIIPVEEAFVRWGERISILGGVDMDLLGRASEADVRKRTRQILEICGAQGTGYALGTGNSVANYIPIENYMAMLDEGRRWNREH